MKYILPGTFCIKAKREFSQNCYAGKEISARAENFAGAENLLLELPDVEKGHYL